MDQGTQSTTGDGSERQLSTSRRLAPVVGLFVLAPLIGEFLLGNLPVTWLWVLPTMAAMYGGGAVLIRETTRRLGLGWPSVVLLGLAYALVEEAFVTQSLFDPDYLGIGLLEYGYVPELGIGLWWTVFVLGIHTVWSTAVPIALTESLVPDRRRTPWLGPVGLVVTALVFVTGCAALFVFQQAGVVASRAQLLGSAVVVVTLVGVAVTLRRDLRDGPDDRRPPEPRTVGATFLVLGSAFMSLTFVMAAIPASLNAAAMVAVFLLGAALLVRWGERPGWTAFHDLAATGGLLLTYCWFGFVQVPSTGDTSPMVDLLGNAVFAGCAVVLLVLARRRLTTSGTDTARTPST